MQPWMLDLAITVLILGITYALTSEGLWGSALIFFNVFFAALIALNFYETLAGLIVANASGLASWADLLCLGGLFLVTLVILKVLTGSMAPTMVRFPSTVQALGRLVFGLAGATLTVAVLLLMLDTAPVHRKIFGMIDYKSQPPWNLGIDRKLLAFFQYTTGYIFPSYSSEFEDPEFGNAKVFDRKGSWLIDHQNGRPFPASGEGKVPEPEVAAPPSESGGAGSPQPGGMPPGGGMPGGAARWRDARWHAWHATRRRTRPAAGPG